MSIFTGLHDLNSLPSDGTRVVRLATRFYNLINQELDPEPDKDGWIFYALYSALLWSATSAEFPDDDLIIAAALGCYSEMVKDLDVS